MRYEVRTSIVRMIGPIWQPGIVCAQDKSLSAYDIENIKGYGEAIGHPGINRDSVLHWLCLNSGDFSNITDFEASIEDGDNTIDIPWALGESELTYCDAMFPVEEDEDATS